MFRQVITALLAVLALNAYAAVEVNQASRAELETVKGIGPGLSAKILEARKAGSFKDWGDLVQRVGGIGAGNATKLSQGGLTVGSAAYDGAAATKAPAKAAKETKAAKKSRKAEAASAA
jgi:competence protein ComEA